MASSSGGGGGGVATLSMPESVPDQFPVGLRVLVVDDDVTCLRILEQMLRKCMYTVTTCSQATVALELLRERKGCFDIVLSDVHMPDMDGFKLLELVGLEMDLPVIMMSADGRTGLVMRGIRHGACDYLIKPIREEELKNIWQHVVRKKWGGSKDHEFSGSMEDNNRHKRPIDDAEYASSMNEEDGTQRAQKKRRDRDSKEEDDAETENDDPATSKKPRVVWSVELHQQFVNAVNQLGIDKAVPKRILELMNVPGLTRENVASHLQKFRLYLKRLSGVAQQQNILPNFCGPLDQNPNLGSLGRFDIQALAAAGQIPPQALAALQAELINKPTGNVALPVVDQPALLQASLQGAKCIAINQGVAYGQPLMKCPSVMSKHLSQPIVSSEDLHSGIGAWQNRTSGNIVPGGNLGGLSAENGNTLYSIIQKKRQQQREQQQMSSAVSEPVRSVNVQPSCLVVPSQASASFQMANSPASVNQNCSFNRNSVIDYSISSQSNNIASGVGQIMEREVKLSCVPSVFSGADTLSASLSSCSTSADMSSSRQEKNSGLTFGGQRQAQLQGLVPSMSGVQGYYNVRSRQVLDQEPLRNLGFGAGGPSIPSRFALDETESAVSGMNHGGNKVKQEPNMGFTESGKVGMSMVQPFPPNDLMGVFSD